MPDISLKRLVPHRGRMLLLDHIVSVDEQRAVTASIVNDGWPLVNDGLVSSLLCIELVAQTASVFIGWREIQKNNRQKSGRGWLVGIKQAVFAAPHIPLERRLTTRVEVDFSYDHYTGIRGRVDEEGRVIAEVRLQVMRSESDSVRRL